MATYTSYLNLEKPTTSETFNLLKMNQNWDKIDAGVSALNSKTTFQKRTIIVPYNCSANGQYNTNLKDKIDADLPSDYSCMGIIGYTTNEINAYVVACRYDSGSYSLQIKNLALDAIAGNMAIDYLAKHN